MKLHNFKFLLIALFTINLAMAQSDEIATNKGVLKISPILHATLVFEWDGKTIFVDPYGGAALFEGFSDPDLIIITDIHGDHLHMETLNGINTKKATIVAPRAVTDQLPAGLSKEVVVLSNGDQKNVLQIAIKALPMYNLPETDDSRHPKGRGNGYVLEMGGKLIYLSGDTEGIPEMRSLRNIDVAFVCMNEPYTMDINQAADAVLDFKPKIVYPYHYRGQGGLSDVEKFKELVAAGNPDIEVRLRKWYP